MDRRRGLLAASQMGKNFKPIIDINNYLTIEALEDGLTASLSVNACEYCVNGDGNWKSLAAGTATQSINSGQILSFRGELTPNSSNGIGTFTVNKNFNLKGNCMSMLFGDAGKDARSLDGKGSAFRRLFYNCTYLKEVSENFLPALDTYDFCYLEMFRGCTSLTAAPNIYATNAAYQCCMNMFEECTILTKAPVLAATDLGYQCYRGMFSKCARLTKAPELPATTLGVSCYAGMFSKCTSLETAPILKASKLTYESYWNMFYGCSNLKKITMLATDISEDRCLYSWIDGVASTGTFVKHPNMTSLPTGTSGIPSGWTVVNDGEEIGGEEIGGSLTFPVTISKNTSAQQVIDFYNHIISQANGNVSYYFSDDEIVYINRNGIDERIYHIYYCDGSLGYIEAEISDGYYMDIYSNGRVDFWD